MLPFNKIVVWQTCQTTKSNRVAMVIFITKKGTLVVISPNYSWVQRKRRDLMFASVSLCEEFFMPLTLKASCRTLCFTRGQLISLPHLCCSQKGLEYTNIFARTLHGETELTWGAHSRAFCQTGNKGIRRITHPGDCPKAANPSPSQQSSTESPFFSDQWKQPSLIGLCKD